MYCCKCIDENGYVSIWYVDFDDLCSFLNSHCVIEYALEDIYFERVHNKDFDWKVITL